MRAPGAPGPPVGLAGLAVLASAGPADGAVLAPAGPLAASIAQQAWVLLAGGGLIFAAVLALLAGGVLGSPRHPIRRALRAHPAAFIIGGGVLLPTLALTALLADSVRRVEQVGEPAPGTLVVSVTAHMWWWELHYPHPQGGMAVVAANELHLPAGRPVRLALTSSDVIHSLWVPALAGKMDMLPGRITHLVLQAGRPGLFRAQCAEFCGQQHARMALPVVVHPAGDFDAWLQREAQAAAAVQALQPQRGRAAFLQLRCGVCHSVRGVVDGARRGPDLTHMGSRLTLGAGRLPNGPGAQPLRDWLAGVQHLKPGVHMPSFGHLDPAVLDDLAAYLHALQ
jgi:cytochrome c oxidase subunit 2